MDAGDPDRDFGMSICAELPRLVGVEGGFIQLDDGASKRSGKGKLFLELADRL